MALADAPPNPSSKAQTAPLAPTNGTVVADVTSSASSIDLAAFSGQWVTLKAEGTAPDRVGFNAWATPAPTIVGQQGRNVDPDLAARSGEGQCQAIEVGETVKRFVLPGFTTLRVIAATGTVVLRITRAQI